MTPYHQARTEARPYAKALVAARDLPARFNQADIDHAVDLEAGAIASIAVTQGRSVDDVVRRLCPELFPVSKRRAA